MNPSGWWFAVRPGIKEIDEKCTAAINKMIEWFGLKSNSRRRVCMIWVLGKPFKVRKNYIKHDIEKIYKKIKLDLFKI